MDTLEKLLMYRLRVGSVARIDVCFHWTLLFVAIYFLVMFRADPKLGILFVMALFGSIFLHELGHCWGARRVGGDAREVILWPLGGLAMINAPMRPWPQFFSTVTGPLVNLILVAICLPLFFLVGGSGASLWSLGAGGVGQAFLIFMIQINLVLLIFNVIPAFPMDGGRILHTALWPKLGFHTALNVAIVAAMVCSVGMIVIGLFIHDLMLVCIGLFVLFGALHERRVLRYGLYDEELAMGSPWASSLPSYDPAGIDEIERKPSRFARWRERRRRRREAEATQRRAELRARLDEILAKVSADGMDSLSKEERAFLDHASAELRKEQRSS